MVRPRLVHRLVWHRLVWITVEVTVDAEHLAAFV